MTNSTNYMITYQSDSSGERIIMKGSKDECETLFNAVSSMKNEENNIKLTLLEVNPLRTYQELI